jgi:hypothetical protein
MEKEMGHPVWIVPDVSASRTRKKKVAMFEIRDIRRDKKAK